MGVTVCYTEPMRRGKTKPSLFMSIAYLWILHRVPEVISCVYCYSVTMDRPAARGVRGDAALMWCSRCSDCGAVGQGTAVAGKA